MWSLVHPCLGGETMAEYLRNLFTSYDVNDVEGQAGPSRSELVSYVPAVDDTEMEE